MYSLVHKIHFLITASTASGLFEIVVIKISILYLYGVPKRKSTLDFEMRSAPNERIISILEILYNIWCID